jgi:hypothetical protein
MRLSKHWLSGEIFKSQAGGLTKLRRLDILRFHVLFGIPRGFPNTILYVFLVSHIPATCPTHRWYIYSTTHTHTHARTWNYTTFMNDNSRNESKEVVEVYFKVAYQHTPERNGGKKHEKSQNTTFETLGLLKKLWFSVPFSQHQTHMQIVASVHSMM